METRVKSILLVVVLALLMVGSSSAQKGVDDGSKYGHGEDSIRALVNLSMYKQFYKQKSYEDAIKAWRVVFYEAPIISKNMYMHGINMYKLKYQKAKTVAERQKYTDSVMMIYDRRIEYFGEKGYYLARKAVDLSSLSPDKKQEAYDLFTQSIEILGNEAPDFAMNELMRSALSLYLDGKITKDEMVNNFALCSDIITHQIRETPSVEDRTKLEQIQANVELIFTQSGAADCESLISVLEPRFKAKPNDLETVQNIVNLLRTRDCEGSDLYEKSAESLYKLEPSANAAYSLARVFLKKENWSKSSDYYAEAIKSESDSLTKARYFKELAEITLVVGSPVKAVRYANNALRINPSDGSPYLTIGKAYANAKNFGENKFEARTIYWAAVDMFYRAKSIDTSIVAQANKLINVYSQYFPDKEEAFFYNVTEGSDYTVKGWINRTTKVRFN